MSASSEMAATCPFHEGRTDSKTARVAAEQVKPERGSRLVQGYAQLRQVLTSRSVAQSGVQSAPVEQADPMQASIFFLEGEAHQQRRTAIAGFFTPKAIATRHMPVIEGTADALIAEFRSKGRARLDDLTLRLSAAVVMEVIGLTNSDLDGMTKRIAGSSRATMAERGGIWKLIAAALARYYAMLVFIKDVRPAIAARRTARKEDVISRLLDEGRSDKEILIECLTFGLAGMGTTREFMVVAAWHLFERDDLRQRFLDADETGKMAILMEILRLEPVASMIYRTAREDMNEASVGCVSAGTRMSLCIRAANLDEAEVGPDATTLDPDRAKRLNVSGTYMSFGNGAHHCPGWRIALTETRVLLDKLFRIPGIRLARQPDISWVPPMLQSYELRNAIIECDRV